MDDKKTEIWEQVPNGIYIILNRKIPHYISYAWVKYNQKLRLQVQASILIKNDLREIL